MNDMNNNIAATMLANAVNPTDEDDLDHSPSAGHAHLHTRPKLATESSILAVLWDVLGVCGVQGEERNAKLTYLAITSRLLADPVSIVIKGLSSSGKSFTTEQVVKFFPASSVIKFTGMSERALIYSDEEYAHRTILLYEATALREDREKSEGNQTAYFIRSLLSEGRIDYSVTIRDKKDGFKTRHIVKTGPTNIIITTTSVSLHGENETRMLSLSTNDTPDQTRAIMRSLASPSAVSVDYSEWHELQEWLARTDARVSVPYALFLAENIPPVAVRLRRDFRAILRLIETHAFLHQATRDVDEAGRIVATVEDYATVRDLIADIIASGLEATVPATVKETVGIVAKLDAGTGVKVKEVAAALGLDRSAAARRLKTAAERGYIVKIEDRTGKPAIYMTGEPMPAEDGEIMPTVEGVHAHLTANAQACATASDLNGNDNVEGCAGVRTPQRGKNGKEFGASAGEVDPVSTLKEEPAKTITGASSEVETFLCLFCGKSGLREGEGCERADCVRVKKTPLQWIAAFESGPNPRDRLLGYRQDIVEAKTGTTNPKEIAECDGYLAALDAALARVPKAESDDDFDPSKLWLNKKGIADDELDAFLRGRP